ncbi:MAG: M17 family peptidase N-terminal domain-containing protein, partial [Burkholderiaceae bacterium]
MNFELKTLSWTQAASVPASLLVVLVTKAACAQAKASQGAIAALVASARTAGDCDGSAAKVLQAYTLPGISAPKVMLVGAGEGAAREVAKSVAAAIAAYKAGKDEKAAKVVLSLA